MWLIVSSLSPQTIQVVSPGTSLAARRFMVGIRFNLNLHRNISIFPIDVTFRSQSRQFSIRGRSLRICFRTGESVHHGATWSNRLLLTLNSGSPCRTTGMWWRTNEWSYNSSLILSPYIYTKLDVFFNSGEFLNFTRIYL